MYGNTIINNSRRLVAASASGREVLQMKEKKLIGITMSEVLDVLAEKLKAGSKLESVVKLTECATPEKDLKVDLLALDSAFLFS